MSKIFVQLRDRGVSFFDASQGVSISGDTIKAVDPSTRVKKALLGGLLIKLTPEQAKLKLQTQLEEQKVVAKEGQESYKAHKAEQKAREERLKSPEIKPNFNAVVEGIQETLASLGELPVTETLTATHFEQLPELTAMGFTIGQVVTEEQMNAAYAEYRANNPMYAVTQADLEAYPGLSDYLVEGEEIPFTDIDTYLGANEITLVAPKAFKVTVDQAFLDANPGLLVEFPDLKIGEEFSYDELPEPPKGEEITDLTKSTADSTASTTEGTTQTNETQATEEKPAAAKATAKKDPEAKK